MPNPEGSLTSAQYEILEIVWSREPQGASVAEIWDEIATRRPVGRTTVLNLVDRLQKRGWLVRRRRERPSRYVAALDRQKTAAFLAGSFVDDFFAGSASRLVMSLLGTERCGPQEIAELRRILESASSGAQPKKRG
jgi:predicted transcriptional regulator